MKILTPQKLILFFGLAILAALNSYNVNAQCCAGASPLAGGSNISVLEKGQLEISTRYQYTYGDKTYRGDTVNNIALFKNVFNHYAFLNVGYGVSANLSFYAACGYYPIKAEVLQIDTVTGNGLGELILFPKYKVLGLSNDQSKTELTLGLGMKIPVGEYDQSRVIYTNPKTGEEISVINSPATQPSTGSNDFIFNLQFLRAYPKKTIYFFTNLTYIKRGTNPIGQNFGNIASASMIIGKNIFEWMGVAAKIKAEKADSLIDPIWPSTQKNTGYKKFSIVPSININPIANLTFTASFEYPFYQYMRGVQIATKFIALASLNYRIQVKRKETVIEPEQKTIIPIE